MVSMTYSEALAKVGASVPAHLIADAEIPILTGPQAQGDILIAPVVIPEGVVLERVEQSGVQVVKGEATGNSHFLHQGFDSPGVQFARVEAEDLGESTIIGYVRVPDGQSAQLIHTDEHGSNGIGPGDYALYGKREQADLIRRVTD